MLKVFRDNLKYLSWILWVVIGLFVLFAFVDFGSGLGGQAGAPNSVAAHVGDHKVTVEDFQREYRQLGHGSVDARGARSRDALSQYRYPR